jgi:hypothetical protein
VKSLCVAVLVASGVLMFVALVTATAGAAIGLFFGAIVWAFKALAGPLSSGGSVPWWLLALILLALVADFFLCSRRSRRGDA